MATLPECPPSLRQIQHFLKAAAEHDARDPCVAYWARLHALQQALRIPGAKGPPENQLLIALMDWLENEKKTRQNDETVTNEVAAQAHLENYALKLFLYADKQDRDGNYGKNVVKAFYTAGVIYDILMTFGELTEEATQNRKYAKWKAAYIHNCLKNGETPVPGPIQDEEDELNINVPTTSNEESTSNIAPRAPEPSQPNTLNPDSITTNVLPSVPHTPDPNPGGFRAYVPPSVPTNTPYTPYTNVTQNDYSNVNLTPEQMAKAQKYCKWAASALNYDDVKTAITNLGNALQLLQTGRDPA